MDKRDRAEIFRDRLSAQMAATGLTRSALARATGVDRSTVAQLLAADAARLPNAHLAAECARVLGVSSDWLLGLSDWPERPGDVFAAAMTVTEAARSSADAQLHDWHREAAGYKIRHVPATLPDVLKTEPLMNWEYSKFLGRTPEQAIGASQDRLGLLGGQMSDYEIAISIGELRAFAAGAGYYQGLSAEIRRAQLDYLITTARDLFPSLRLFLFDARRVFSAPVTVFGSFLGVVYVGRFYLAFRSRDRVRSLTEHFDNLIREADVDARDVPVWLEALRAELPEA
ncbi:helix-turn-helix transcriptional regulator [Tropicimonas sp. TH_r6]|uniref:helix-turn-helix domain-containing protein n=1 Tax=Tropicimonas sp. TH_r6 TaxID=3082085 RepID=UPI0029557587|nr:helix-turn-helix transcriptional regulator [Tropicimonas sp. TH_r6]MDV7144712.1 helix-turn-helix transcriptional regulator [Tropicimonas sp. TH_r6]